MKQQTWPDFLAKQAEERSDQTALIFNDERWSFGQLNQHASVVAGQLSGSCAGQGSHIGLLAANSPGYVVLVHAAVRVGAVLVPLNTRLTVAELKHQIKRAKICLLAHDRRYQSVANELAGILPALQLQPLEALGHGGDTAYVEQPAALIPADQLHSIIFTSGTTGQPKGALLSCGNLVSSALASARHLGHGPDDRWLAAMPLFHVGGLAILIRSVVCGFTVELHERFDAPRVNERLLSGEITIISVVSTMLQRMLSELGEGAYPTSLRTVLHGGGPAPRPLVVECFRRGIPIAPSYGMTETCSQSATLLPDEVAKRSGSSGRPLPGLEILIDQGKQQPSPDGVGEILIRGPSVIRGYLGDEQTGILEDGWFRTGDLGRVDADGYLYVIDRRDDLIISGGENIYPAEVEAVLTQHAAVAEVAVVGRPDAEWGQVPVAFVCCQAGKTVGVDDLEDFCRNRLASYRIPRTFIIVDELPRNSGGKILRRELQSRLLTG